MDETTADDAVNWAELPEDMLLTAMSAMDALDVVRSSAVCSHWRSTYATLRRLRLRSSKQQSPCLLYPRPHAPSDPDNAAAAPLYLYSPSTDTTVRMRLPHDDAIVIAGSVHGWLFATDQAANPYLLNPLTGAQAPLPPVTTFQCVDGDGNGLYRHVALSAGGGDPSCVVLVVHERPMDGLIHFARPGDERWSSALSSLGHGGFVSAVFNDKDGLFYVLQFCGTVHALDLHHGPASSSRVVTRTQGLGLGGHCRYLAVTPCGGVLLVARTYSPWEHTDVDDPHYYYGEISFSVYKLGLGAEKAADKLEGIGDQYVLLLGDKSSAVCAPVREEDRPRLRTNCFYLADFVFGKLFRDREQHCFRLIRGRDIAACWDFASGNMHNIAHRLWPALRSQMEIPASAPAPIWITPSLF